MFPAVVKVDVLDDYQLHITFDNKEKKLFDMKPYLDRGVFRKLRDRSVFQAATVAFDTVEWPHHIDMDPEVLYEFGYDPPASV